MVVGPPRGAAVGGAYDLESSQLPGLFDGRVGPGSAVFYTAYFLTAQNRLHHFYSDPREVFRAPYANHVEELFDSHHPAVQIAGRLPETFPELLTDQWYAKLRRPHGRLLAVWRRNDFTCDWKPNVLVTHYSATGDHDVPMANIHRCAQWLSAHGTAPGSSTRATSAITQRSSGHFRRLHAPSPPP